MKHRKKLALTLGGAMGLIFAVAACAPVTLLNTITPSSSFSKAKDVSYGPLERQKLDLYKADTPKPDAPMLVFVHGGSWQEGSKDIYKFLADGFTKDGYDIAVPNYRLYPQTKYPGMIEDTAKAIAYAAVQNPDRPIVVIGHSAGAYNALMAIMDPRFMAAENLATCERVAGVISLAAPTGAYELKDPPYPTIFPGRFQGEDAPLAHADQPLPAMFLINGADDTTVGRKNAEMLAEKIEASGGNAKLKIYDGMNHTEAVQFLSRHFDGDSSLKSDIASFIDNLPKTGNFCR
ncbi:alpha/beta hydrolase [Litorimonas sp. RW-G-Af-16]|uniref:alpha/beta hydrolase n=1 Tax=Litorimonas sp. RW-G-Af-16 TaxID=3241168 RepID=UPI00390CB59D